jgi:hypothetical protein
MHNTNKPNSLKWGISISSFVDQLKFSNWCTNLLLGLRKIPK